MGRLKVTPKGKVKKNIPITRVGKRQYLKRRFAHLRAVDSAGTNNEFTQKYFDAYMTPGKTFTRLGLAIDPNASKNVVAERKRRVSAKARRRLEEENSLAEHVAQEKANKIARPMSEQESTTIANLIAKYGTDFKRMTFDAKLNPFQLNARQLQRQAVNYLRWEKAAFPKAFAEAEAKGWFSVDKFADPKLRKARQ